MEKEIKLKAAERRLYLNVFAIACFSNAVCPAKVAFDAVQKFRRTPEVLEIFFDGSDREELHEMFEDVVKNPLGL